MIVKSSRYKEVWRNFRKSEDGNPTIEFCLMMPLFMLLFTMAWEFGIWQTRQVLLDHGLDQTVREVRIGRLVEPDHEDLVVAVCNHAGLIQDCKNQLRLEMFVADIEDLHTQISGTAVRCRDRSDDADPFEETSGVGENNQLMFLRACALFDPILPMFGVGETIDDAQGYYVVTSTASFVMEPFQ